MSTNSEKELLWTRGLMWHPHQYYSFFALMEWKRSACAAGSAGEIVGPDPYDLFTVIAIALRDPGWLAS